MFSISLYLCTFLLHLVNFLHKSSFLCIFFPIFLQVLIYCAYIVLDGDQWIFKSCFNSVIYYTVAELCIRTTVILTHAAKGESMSQTTWDETPPTATYEACTVTHHLRLGSTTAYPHPPLPSRTTETPSSTTTSCTWIMVRSRPMLVNLSEIHIHLMTRESQDP